ncbi:MAG TPA: hypothetical protein VHY33_06765 [Thermoanaerobaculia bacterium]|jgi:hypothetical protein|nr:hypothetical protein [Thermoanaerobaculia bacterium]
MAAIALIATAVLALLVALLFAALVEMYRDVRQLRDAMGILDRPLPVNVTDAVGMRASTYGLPRAIDAADSALVLFLSDRCGTCRQLAHGLTRPLVSGLWLVLEVRSDAGAADFIERYGLADSAREGRIIVDPTTEIARRIGIDTTPVGVRIENGAIAHATTVPSTRYLNTILPEPVELRQAG